MEYKLIIDKDIDLWAANCQIERLLGFVPIGLGKSNEELIIQFKEDLDEDTLKSLNELINSENFGEFPKDAQKLYIGNVWNLRDIIESDTGKTVLAVDFSELQEDGSFATVVYLSGEDLTTEEKTDIKTSLSSMVADTSEKDIIIKQLPETELIK